MSSLLWFTLIISTTLIAAQAHPLYPSTVTLEGVVYFPHSSPGPSNTQLILNNGQFSVSPLPLDGTFSISDLTPGRYLLEIKHSTHTYSPVLVEISPRPTSPSKIAAYLYDIEHGKGARLKYPLRLSPGTSYSFFLPEQSINISSLFKNPMLLVGLVSLGLMGIMSKVHASVDPEELQSLTGGDEPQYKSAFVERLTNSRPTISGSSERAIGSTDNGSHNPTPSTTPAQRTTTSNVSKRKKK